MRGPGETAVGYRSACVAATKDDSRYGGKPVPIVHTCRRGSETSW